MANNDHNLNLQDNSKYRVAYDLMNRIVASEVDSGEMNREYFLRLYRQCYDSVSGCKSIDEVVANQPKQQQYNSMDYRFKPI